MENLVLHSPQKTIRIFREGANVDFANLTSIVLSEIKQYDWLDTTDHSKSENNWHFKEDYMAVCAQLVWNYHLKKALK